MSYLLLAVFCMLYQKANSLQAVEPVCSPFDFELKTLEVMLRTENRMEKMLDEKKLLQDSVTAELEEIKKLKVEIEKTVQTVQDELQKVQEISSAVKNPQTGNVVAFSVKNPTTSLVKGVPTFSDVIINAGKAYNEDSGVFTSPVGGLYMFMVSIASRGKHDVYCWLLHNDGKSVFSRTYSDNSYTTATAAVYLLLSKGDTVSIGHCTNWNRVYNTDNISTFSGALLQMV